MMPILKSPKINQNYQLRKDLKPKIDYIRKMNLLPLLLILRSTKLEKEIYSSNKLSVPIRNKILMQKISDIHTFWWNIGVKIANNLQETRMILTNITRMPWNTYTKHIIKSSDSTLRAPKKL